MLNVQNVVKTFDGFRALDGLTMTVPQGAVYGLVGPNGAGKSTVIRNITGIYKPDSGTITLDGAPVFENPAAKARIGYIPDDVFYFPAASIREMAKFYKGVCPKFDLERFEKLREAFAHSGVCFVIGGLGFSDSRSLSGIIAHAAFRSQPDLIRRLPNSDGDDGYLLRAGGRLLVLLPDEPEQLEKLLGGILHDFIQRSIQS